jgi:3-mercaptopyruvate sulfurtransferase SseA
MKHIYIISLGGLILLMGMFFIVATIQSNNKYKFKKSAGDMLQEVSTQDQFVNIEKVKDMINDSGNYKLIDIRTPKEYVGYHIEGAINIPFERLLDESNEYLFRNDAQKILYGQNSVNANSVWMVLTQYGYENISVLNGGITQWRELEKNKDDLKNQGVLDENPEFDYAGIMEGDGEK